MDTSAASVVSAVTPGHLHHPSSLLVGGDDQQQQQQQSSITNNRSQQQAQSQQQPPSSSATMTFEESLESGYSTPNSRNRRVIREIIV